MENWKSLVIQRRRFTDSIPSRLEERKNKTKINQTTVHLHDSIVHVTRQRILIRCIRFVIVD
jgi:hypothetical protein